MDTIYAVATARGRAGIGVIRVSGPAAFDAAAVLTTNVPEPRRAALRRLLATDGSLIDEALVVTFEAGASFTGEQSVEFHAHGGLATLNAILAALSRVPGLRPAEPGEFTRRALENGRLDLAQVEGLADLIDAETEAQRKFAIRTFDGSAARSVSEWRERLVGALALLEVTIDFADEEVPVDVAPDVRSALDQVIEDLEREISRASLAERVHDGFEVAIMGAPNAGKSTLLNALAGRSAAITSEVAGTTRDVIEVRMELKGLPVTLLDTAGLRETSDEIEKIGVERAKSRAAEADLRIFLLEPGQSADPDLEKTGDISVGAKADVNGSGVSGISGQGIDELVGNIATTLESRVPSSANFSRERQRNALRTALSALEDARNLLPVSREHPELVAEHVWTAVRALESILGKVDIEAILDDIFSRFCLGK